MTSFQLPSAIFPENAIMRAERFYQQRSARKPRLWRRWINQSAKWLLIALALIEFGGLLAASLIQRDPTPLVQSLGPLPILLILLTIFYHLYLMFQTMSLAAHSITREKESQTWEMLVLTGIDARQIVRGKWWATVQRQLSRYAVLALLRAGMIAAIGIILSVIFSSFSYSYTNYPVQIRLAHPISILFSTLIGAGYTFANLGLSAACGVMASAASKRSSVAILRGFASQIVISVVVAIAVLWLMGQIFDHRFIRGNSNTYLAFTDIALSFTDNGLMSGVSAIGPLTTNYYEQVAPSPIMPIAIEWIVAGLLGIALYAPLIWFALWRAEKNAVHALATAVDKLSSTRLSRVTK